MDAGRKRGDRNKKSPTAIRNKGLRHVCVRVPRDQRKIYASWKRKRVVYTRCPT